MRLLLTSSVNLIGNARKMRSLLKTVITPINCIYRLHTNLVPKILVLDACLQVAWCGSLLYELSLDCRFYIH